MKTYSKRPAGFTLVEVLVVAGVVGALTAIFVPVLGHARRSSQLVSCLNNARQLGTATLKYASDNDETLPFCNWDAGTGGYPNAQQGWLYTVPLKTGNPAEVISGSLWPYLNNFEAYHCPIPPADPRIDPRHPSTRIMTSYLMNGAVNTFGVQVVPLISDGKKTSGIRYFTIHAFKPDDILFIEADERGVSPWYDGSTYPTESFNPKSPAAGGLTIRHGTVATIACFDGHAEQIGLEEYSKLTLDRSRKNRAWCSPGRRGHGQID